LSIAVDDANCEVFEKTLAFYATLISRGCYGGLDKNAEDDNFLEDLDVFELPIDSCHKTKPKECHGKMVLFYSSDGSIFIRCFGVSTLL